MSKAAVLQGAKDHAMALADAKGIPYVVVKNPHGAGLWVVSLASARRNGLKPLFITEQRLKGVKHG